MCDVNEFKNRIADHGRGDDESRDQSHKDYACKEYRCIGKIDTACRLIEPFSRAPVIIVDSSVMSIAPEAPARVIPYSAVGISSFLRAVKADKVCIDKKEIYGTVYIASADQLDTHFRAIINSEIIR